MSLQNTIVDNIIAIELDDVQAVLLSKICYFSKLNEKNKNNQHDGRSWVWNSVNAWHVCMPYKSRGRIYKGLRDLHAAGLVFVGNYNRQEWDKTAWYSPNWPEVAKRFPHLAASNSVTPNNKEPNEDGGNGTTHSEDEQVTRSRHEQVPPPTRSQCEQTRSQCEQPVHGVNDNTNNYLNTNSMTTESNKHNVGPSPSEPSPPPTAPGLVAGSGQMDIFQNEQTGTALASNTPTQGNPTPKKAKAIKMVVRTWQADDPFAAVFANLTKLSICKATFETEHYRQALQKYMEQLSLSITELVKLSDEWQEYHNERTIKPKAALSSFRTWINNYTDRRNTNAQRATNTQGRTYGKQQRPDFSADNGKFANVNDDKPWESW